MEEERRYEPWKRVSSLESSLSHARGVERPGEAPGAETGGRPGAAGSPTAPRPSAYDRVLLGTAGGTRATAPPAWLSVPRAARRLVSFSDTLITVTATAQ